MNILRKTYLLTVVLFITISAFGYYFGSTPKFRFYHGFNAFTFSENKEISNFETINRLKGKALLAKQYLNDKKGFDGTYCFLIDMRLPSGKNRFFVYNLLKDSLEAAGLVTHGKGSESESGNLVFSNIPNSNCTSLGKYKIGNSYNGNFGLSYKLKGLDKINSKAFDRFVVLHAHECVPNDEVSPLPICESWGCPTVSPAFLTQLKSYLDEAAKPVMLWIFY